MRLSCPKCSAPSMHYDLNTSFKWTCRFCMRGHKHVPFREIEEQDKVDVDFEPDFELSDEPLDETGETEDDQQKQEEKEE